MWVRVAAVVVGAVVAIALVLSYSRSGILAAGIGAWAAVVLVTPGRRRLAVGLAIAAAAGLSGWLLYPTFVHHRDQADLANLVRKGRLIDGSGWSRNATGPIGAVTAILTNDGPSVLRVGVTPGAGMSLPIGQGTPTTTFRLRFQARAPNATVTVRYGMEDDRIGAGPEYRRVLLDTKWRSFGVSWRPVTQAANARVYFWAVTPGTFELRTLTLRSGTGPSRSLPTRLLGPGHDLQSTLSRVERGFVKSRTGAARLAVDAFLAHPLFGLGWERFERYAAPRSGVGPIATHDEYLKFAAELGAPGILAIVTLCLAALWALVGIPARPLGAALAGVLVVGAINLGFSNFLEVPAVVLPSATALGIAAATSARLRRAETPSPSTTPTQPPAMPLAPSSAGR